MTEEKKPPIIKEGQGIWSREAAERRDRLQRRDPVPEKKLKGMKGGYNSPLDMGNDVPVYCWGCGKSMGVEYIRPRFFGCPHRIFKICAECYARGKDHDER